MNEEQFVTSLVEAGLTEYQAEAYSTLLDHGMTSATTIAEHSSVPVSRIYDVLRELEANSYAETIEQDTLHARPAPPETVLEDLRSKSKRLESAADEVEQRWESPTIHGHTVSVLKQPERVIERSREAIADADTFVRLAASQEDVRRLQPALETAIDSSCQVNLCVYEPPDSNGDPPAYDTCGTEVRESMAPVPFLLVDDDHNVYFTPNSRCWGEFGLVMQNPYVAAIFGFYHYASLWAPLPVRSVNEEWVCTFSSLRSFTYSVAPLLSEGIDLKVSVYGQTPESGTERTVRGTLAYIDYPSRWFASDGGVRLEELLSYLTMYVRPEGDTDEEVVTVGGWGAVCEDLQAKRIVIEGVVAESSQ